VGHAANVHLDLALPNFGVQEWTPLNDALREVFPGAPELRDGSLYPSDAPGLGVDVDEAAAARFPVEPNGGQFRDGVVQWTQTRLPDGSLAWP
jgi:mannonate dehydratase